MISNPPVSQHKSWNLYNIIVTHREVNNVGLESFGISVCITFGISRCKTIGNSGFVKVGISGFGVVVAHGLAILEIRA